MSETIVLDPSQVATGRTSLDITPWLDQDGIDWGDAEIEAFTAKQTRGESAVDFRVPNRSISGGLLFTETLGGTTTAQARAKIQQKLGQLQQEGGWIKRVTNAGGTVYADVVNATFRATSAAGWESAREINTDANFTLECIPDFYGDEVTLGDHVETSACELVFTETAIPGDYPARVRVVVGEDQAQDQLGLIWAFRSRHYSSSALAASKYEAEALQALDASRILALTGASGGTAVTHGTISSGWTPIVGTNFGGTGYLIHEGTYRMFARVYSTSGTAVQTRAVWDVGDLVNPSENSATRLAGASNFYIVDYGELRLDPAPVGAHRWQGQIQAKGDVGTENFSVDRIWLVNADEGMGVLTAPVTTTIGLASYSARDEFNQAAGVLVGKTLPAGGAWTGAGAAGDWSVEATGHTLTRAVADATPRYGIAGATNYALVQVQADVKVVGTTATSRNGVLLRYADTANYAAGYVAFGGAGQSLLRFALATTARGAVLLAQAPVVMVSGVWYTVACQIDAAGKYKVWFVPQGASLGLPVISGQDTDLATGGAIATGKPGITEQSTNLDTSSYDNFKAWVPQPDAVAYANRSVQLTTQGQYRQDSGGTAYGPVSQVVGDLPRLPPAGLDGRSVEVFLKASRGDFATQPDSGIDDISAKVFYRASYLFAP